MLESQIIDAVNYVVHARPPASTARGGQPEPLGQLGAHDGSYAFDSGLSALTGPGKIITAAAGNKGLDNGHARVRPGRRREHGRHVQHPDLHAEHQPARDVRHRGLARARPRFDIKLISPTGITSATIAPGTESGYVMTADGTIASRTQCDHERARRQADRGYVSYGTTARLGRRSGTWKINIKRRSGTTSGTAHMWLVQSDLFGTTTLPAFTGAGIDTASR